MIDGKAALRDFKSHLKLLCLSIYRIKTILGWRVSSALLLYSCHWRAEKLPRLGLFALSESYPLDVDRGAGV